MKLKKIQMKNLFLAYNIGGEMGNKTLNVRLKFRLQ